MLQKGIAMKIGLENESLHLWQQNRGMNVFDFIDFAVELGLDGVQINLVPDFGLDQNWGFLGSNESAYLKKIRQKCDKHNLYIELDTRNLDFDHIIKVLEIAHILDAQVVRSYIPIKPVKNLGTSGAQGKYDIAKVRQNFDISAYDDALPRLREFIPYLKKYRVKLALENHEYETSRELVDVIEKLESPWIGLLFDFGNSMMAWEDPIQAAHCMAPYTLSTHVKDHIIIEEPDDVYGYCVCGVPLGQGNLDIEALCRIMYDKAAIRRLNLETCTPYAAQFKRAPGTGGISQVGQGAFAIKPHPYHYQEIKPAQYYYPQEVSSEYLQRLLEDQKEGVKHSVAYLKKICKTLDGL